MDTDVGAGNCFGNFSGGAGKRFAAARGHVHRTALRSQRFRYSPTDPPARSGDERAFAIKSKIHPALELFGIKISRHDNLQQLAIVGISQNRMLDVGGLQPTRSLAHHHLLTIVLALHPALQAIE